MHCTKKAKTFDPDGLRMQVITSGMISPFHSNSHEVEARVMWDLRCFTK